MQRWEWHSPQARRIGDEADHARLYLAMLAESDYAEKLAPQVGKVSGTVLDIGAGAGTITRHCLAAASRWLAVEPNPEMRRVLASLHAPLAAAGIRLETIACRWQDLAAEVTADAAFAFNVGATHHEADRLYDSLRGRGIGEMVWIVPAQHAPSSFCLAGALPSEFFGGNSAPAYLRTLDQLGPTRAPHSIAQVDWTCRHTFLSGAELYAHFRERLAIAEGSAEAAALADHLAGRYPAVAGAARVCCAKRSAVLRWKWR